MAIPIVSIVTPVRPSGSPFLGELYESILDQDLDGDAWEWLLQIDAQRPFDLGLPTDDPRIRIGWNGAQQGAAGTRNMAVARARGAYVRNIDDDDVMTPGALRASVDVLESDADLAFVTGPVLDLMPDGEKREFSDDLEAGRIEPGTLGRLWIDRGFFGVVHPTCIFLRTSVLLAFGGWTALLGSEDTGLLMAVSTVLPGWQLDRPVLEYRRHAGQTIAEPWHSTTHSKDQRYGFIQKRMEVLADSCAEGRVVDS